MATVVTVNVAMDGSDIQYSIPDDVATITFNPSGGDVSMKSAAAGSAFTIKQDVPFNFTTRNMGNTNIWFNGGGSVTLQVVYMTGLL